MARYEEKRISVTKWQALFHHEREVWETDYASVQTVGFDADRCEDQTIKEMVADAIDEGLERWTKHQEERSRRRAYQRSTQRAARVAAQQRKYSKKLADLGLDWDETPSATGETAPEGKTRLVRARDIDLRELIDRSTIRVSIYPHTFVCPRCYHYQIISGGTSDLACPCCKARMERQGKTDHVPQMQQVAIIHICPRCAKVEELIPEGLQVKDGMLRCQCGAHLHYYGLRGARARDIYWECLRCKRRYPDMGRGRAIDQRNCDCSIYEKDEEGRSKVSKMWVDRSAGSNTYALNFRMLRIGHEPVALSILYARHQQDRAGSIKTWSLEDMFREGGLSGQERLMFKAMFPIRDAFLVSNVRSSTVVYGYSTRKGTIKDDERLPQFFRDSSSNTYRAYVVNEQGRALAIVLDKARIAKAIQHGTKPSYDRLIENEIAALETGGLFQQNIDNPQNFPLIASLHTLEHAIFKQALAQVGLDDFGSVILLREGVILLYERHDIGYGGVVQLTAGQGFLQLVLEAKRIIEGCGHDCDKGCLACIYITDAYCVPFLRDEVNKWYPPNAILMRGQTVEMLRWVREEGSNDGTKTTDD